MTQYCISTVSVCISSKRRLLIFKIIWINRNRLEMIEIQHNLHHQETGACHHIPNIMGMYTCGCKAGDALSVFDWWCTVTASWGKCSGRFRLGSKHKQSECISSITMQQNMKTVFFTYLKPTRIISLSFCLLPGVFFSVLITDCVMWISPIGGGTTSSDQVLSHRIQGQWPVPKRIAMGGGGTQLRWYCFNQAATMQLGYQ